MKDRLKKINDYSFELPKSGKMNVPGKIYSSENIYSKEVSLNQNISISNPKKNLAWKMHNLNHQNFLGNIYLSGIDNLFLKKKNWKK